MGDTGARIEFDKVAKQLAGSETERSVAAFEHGTMTGKMYAPRGSDPQTPHSRDELYVVVTGSGEFVHGFARVPFRPYDVLFAPAGMEHRFENFTDDLQVGRILFS